MVLNQEAKDEHMTHFQAFLNHFRGKPEPLFTFEKDDPPYVQTRLKTIIDRNLQDKVSHIWKEHNLQLIIILASAIIPIVNVTPLVNVTGHPSFLVNIVSSILGGIVLGVTSVLQLKKYHERWILSKTTAGRLSYEYYRWKNKVGEEYGRETDEDSRVASLVKNCECIILSEATQFVGFFQPRQEPPATPQETAQGTKLTTSSA
jgi:hypothetical protein